MSGILFIHTLEAFWHVHMTIAILFLDVPFH